MNKGTKLPSIKKAKWVDRAPIIREVPTIVLFWSISCGQCSSLLKKVQREAWKNAEEFNFISIHMARSAADLEKGKLEEFCRKLQIDFPVLDDVDFTYSNYFGNDFVPTLYLFNSNQLFERKMNPQLPIRELLKKIRFI